MKKAPVIVVGMTILLAVLLGAMMYSVDSEEDGDGILTTFNNMSNLVKRPISVEEIIRQLEQNTEEETTGTNPVSPATPTPPGTTPTSPGSTTPSNQGGNTSPSNQGGNTSTPNPNSTGSTTPPQAGKYNGAKTLSGVLQYIPQGHWWGSQYMEIYGEKLGNSSNTVENAGCYFCSLTMASAFLRNKAITRQEAVNSCTDGNNFDRDLAKGDSVLKSYGVNKSISGDTTMSLDDVKASINSNKPLIIHFTGPTSGGYYKKSGHFALCVGYSDADNALVLYDPGKGPGSADKKLTYKEYTDGISMGNLFMRSFN